MDAGATFLFVAVDIHLWIIISDPSIDPDNVLIVNECRAGSDRLRGDQHVNRTNPLRPASSVVDGHPP